MILASATSADTEDYKFETGQPAGGGANLSIRQIQASLAWSDTAWYRCVVGVFPLLMSVRYGWNYHQRRQPRVTHRGMYWTDQHGSDGPLNVCYSGVHLVGSFQLSEESPGYESMFLETGRI